MPIRFDRFASTPNPRLRISMTMKSTRNAVSPEKMNPPQCRNER
jgi:hypothetical protein